jgi:hypothetical protein
MKNIKKIIELSYMIPILAKEYDGDLLEVLESELSERGMSLEEFIIELAHLVNIHISDD